MASETQETELVPTVVDRVAAFVRRFVFLREPELYTLIALWIVGTHVHDVFDYYGYLFIHSPDRECGKTRLLDVMDRLVFRSSGVLISPTEATLFRTASGHTQFLDEVDSWSGREYATSILNAGFQRGRSVPRMEPNGSGGYTQRYFDAYGPRALAGIGADILSDVVKSRTFAFQMQRRTRQERVEKFRLRTSGTEMNGLAREIATWAAEHREHIRLRYDEPHFPYLSGFSDRTEDVAEPLAVIFEEVYQDDSGRDEVLAEFLVAVRLTRNERGVDPRFRETVMLLLQAAREAGGTLIGNATELTAICGKQADATFHIRVSGILSDHGIKPRSIRLGGEPRKRYEVTYEQLDDIYRRYFADENNPT